MLHKVDIGNCIFEMSHTRHEIEMSSTAMSKRWINEFKKRHELAQRHQMGARENVNCVKGS